MRLLLVDDNAMLRLTLVALLEDAGHAVVEAASLAEARERLRGATVDVALVDFNLGDGVGTELADELGRRQPRVRLAIMSGGAGDARCDGADLFLAKGDDPELILRRLEELARRVD